MAKLSLSTVANILGNPTSAATTINNNSALTISAIENTLSRDGTTPNQMNADIDMNDNDVLNVKDISADRLILDGVVVGTTDTPLTILTEVLAARDDAVAASDEAEFWAGEAEEAAQASYVDTRTALKALDTSVVKYAFLKESGREGNFIWVSGNFSSQIAADTQQGVFIKADAVDATAGAWVRVVVGKFNIKWFGAVGDGTTDNTAAIQAAVNLALSYGTGVFVPKGKFRINSHITGTFPVASSGPGNNKNNYGRFEIIGDAMDLSILYFPTNAGIEIVTQSFQQTVCLNKVSFTAGQAGGGDHALYVRCRYAFFGSYTAQSDIVECCFRGDDGYGENFYWKTCIKLYNMTSVNFDRNTLYGPVASTTAASFGDGVYVSSTTTPGIATSTTPGQGTTYNFTNNNFVFLGRSIVVGNLCQVFSVGSGNHILNGYDGIYVEPGITEARQLMVEGTEISVNGDAIRMMTACSGTNINGNYIAVAPGKSGIVMNTNTGASNSAGTTISGNVFMPLAPGAANGIYINTDFCPVSAVGNTFLGLSVGIALDANSKQVSERGNRFMNCTSNVIDSGTGNSIEPQNDRGLVTQVTSKSTGVTLNKMAGTITTSNQALASGGIATFVVTNSKFKGEDLAVLNVLNGNYSVRAFGHANGSFQIALKNETGGSLSDAVLISFSIIKSAQSV